ncbi:hypothetical protein [Chondromyces crocatus]|uniref:Uncharacterized protein n=1 Tax=Chondromyces crocatus TaxID=52 RepID=A0A0K1ETU8_CHOCO|nr:hypothetical protein [Chondromyces crocatus]AKT44057.1 uncharacterized protein CMC5_082950 [Chondromyces crocatus]
MLFPRPARRALLLVTPDLHQLLAALDPEVRAAVREVDGTLIYLALAQSPRDRLRSASNMARTLMRLRRGLTPSGD